MNGSFMCLNGGPHFFTGGDRCVCGVEEGYVLVKRSEHERLTADLAEARAERAASQERETAWREAMLHRLAVVKLDGNCPECRKVLTLLEGNMLAAEPAAVAPEAGENA
jgi:hypothetical protein